MGQVGHAGSHLRAKGGFSLVGRIDKTWRKVCNLTPAVRRQKHCVVLSFCHGQILASKLTKLKITC